MAGGPSPYPPDCDRPPGPVVRMGAPPLPGRAVDGRCPASGMMVSPGGAHTYTHSMTRITAAHIHISVRLDNTSDEECEYEESFSVFLPNGSSGMEVLPKIVRNIGTFKADCGAMAATARTCNPSPPADDAV